MNTQDFVQSGILESYALGVANLEEQRQVKVMVENDHELSGHLVDVEEGIRSYFNEESVSPPPAVREIIQLRTKQKHNFNKPSESETKKFLDVEVNDTHIKVHKNWRPAFIAVFILSKIFLISGLYFYFKSASQEQELLKLKQEIQHQQLK